MKHRINKPVIFLSLVLSLVFSVASSTILVFAAENYDTIIHISSVEDLKRLSENCRKDKWSRGRIVVLDNDIDLPDDSPIVLASFAGTFNGNGHTIKNVKISEAASSSGFFGIVFKRGFVKDLCVEGKYKPDGTMKWIGGICGTNYGRIENCTFNGSIRATSDVGGIVGRNMVLGEVDGCKSFGRIQGDSFCGGICGYNEGNVSNCINEARVNTKYEDTSITKDELVDAVETIMMGENLNELRGFRTRMDMGGICGFSEGEVFSCQNNGAVGYEHVGYNSGGIVGRSTGFVRGCSNYGKIMGRKDAGGIVGQQQPFLMLDFSEGDLGELDRMVQNLGDSVDNTLSDVSGYSADTTTSLLEISQMADTAVDDIDNISNIANKGANSLSKTAQKTIDVTRVTVDEMDEYLSEILSALDDLDEEILDEDAKTRLSDSEKNEYHSTIQRIKSTLTNSPSGKTVVDRVSSYFENLLDLRNATRSGIVEALELIEKLAGKRDTDLVDAIDELNDAIQEDNDIYDDVMGTIDTTEKFNNKASELNQSLDDAGSRLYATLGQITDKVNETVVATNDDVQGSISSMKDIRAKSDAIREKINDMLYKSMDPDTYTEDKTEDISAENIEAQTDGRTSVCYNYGIISADSNVGGITGTMGFEMDLDPEDDVEKNGKNTFNYVLRSKCVVDKCENHEKVVANRNGGGGIVGRMELGLISHGISYGDVEVESDFAGGICGYSVSEIADSYSKQHIGAERYAGGIAGYGKMIHGCVSMSVIDGAKMYVGAICGSAEDVNRTDIYKNVFYSDGLYGIDGVSYSGIANGISYKKLIAMPGVPGDFSNIVLTFVSEDEDDNEEILARINCEYGEGVPENQIPAVPPREGFAGSWSRKDFSGVLADDRIKAKYKRVETLIESDARRENRRPVLLAEGEFERGEKLSLSEEKTTEKDEKCRFSVKLPRGRTGVHTFRYLPTRKDHTTKILLFSEGGSYRVLPAESFGEYVVFEADGDSFVFGAIEYWNGRYLVMIFGIAVLALVALIVFIVRFSRGKILLQRFIRWLRNCSSIT